MQIFQFSENKEKFTEKLKQLLKENNMTRSELADITGIAKTTIDNYCKTSNNIIPSVENAYNIARAFNISIEELLCISNQSVNEDEFYPKENSITIEGIFKAVNYLLVAFGEENVIDTYTKEYVTSSGIVERTNYALSFMREDDLFRNNSVLCDYLGQIYCNPSVKKTLKDINQEDLYPLALKKWANIDNLIYKDKELYEELELDDDLPFS
jgi:transcriptional regulator with XRE-family HTH domain